MWTCVECAQADSLADDAGVRVKVTGACHHCGKPLCRSHSQLVWDDAFGAAPDDRTTKWAMHCADCRRSHHPTLRMRTAQDSGR